MYVFNAIQSCNTKKALDDVISRTVDQISSIENLSGGMAVQMEACSLDEIPINQNDGANAMSRERYVWIVVYKGVHN